MPIEAFDPLRIMTDRPLKTPEIHESNDFYGHAAMVKRFLGLPPHYPIKAVLPHGSGYPGYIWKVDRDSVFPAIFTNSRHSCRLLRGKTPQVRFPIGPAIHYARSFRDLHQFKALKQSLGKVLLVFPPHSTHHVQSLFSWEWLANDARDQGQPFDTILVCVYWKDVSRDVLDQCHQVGLTCVSAGHIFDDIFLDRSRFLLELADAVLCYGQTSAVGYAMHLGKPVRIGVCKTRLVADEAIILRDTTIGCSKAHNGYYKLLVRALREWSPPDHPRNRRIVDFGWGFDDVRDRASLLRLTAIVEDVCALSREHPAPPAEVFMRQAKWYASHDKPHRADLIIRTLEQNGMLP
ncbi:MAG: hypothetical protein RDU30_08920 [Desulfovibrionaceae bacterium]|nr:hypothetical protein [Desulfovibrionaceae bacterium]